MVSIWHIDFPDYELRLAMMSQQAMVWMHFGCDLHLV